MTVPGIIAIVALALATVAMLVGWYELRRITSRPAAAQPTPIGHEPVGIERLYRENVVVTLKSREAFSGVLYEHNDREVVLREAHGLNMSEDGRDHVAIDGEVLIFVADIAYMQRP